MNTTTICQSCVKLIDKNATLNCDTTKGPCGKCSLLGIECKPVPKQLSLLHQDVAYHHTRWRTALESGDKAMAKEAKTGLTGKANDLIDAIDELENPIETSDDAASGSEATGSKGKKSVSPPRTANAKDVTATKTARKKPTGIVKKPATPRILKPKAQAQLRSKAEKALLLDPTSGVVQHQHSPAAQASATLMNMMARDTKAPYTMDDFAQGGVAKHEPSHALPVHTMPAHAATGSTGGSYYNATQYHEPAPVIINSTTTIDQTNPFTNEQNIFAPALHPDDFSMFHHDQFLEHNSLTSSPTSDPSFLTVDHHAASSSTPFTMPSSFAGAASMHGGLHTGHDVGGRILEQLQTLNTTMSGIYEMMRQQQQQRG